jgi:glycosyltransferase involved in cell wall biosynthesis
MLAPEFYPNWGGAGTYSILLAKGLAETDDVTVFTASRGSTAGNIEAFFGGKLTVRIVSTASDRFFYNLKYQAKVARLMGASREDFDVLHANHAQMPDLFLKLSASDYPTLTTVHSTLSTQMSGLRRSSRDMSRLDRSESALKVLYPALGALEKIYLSKSKHAVCVSSYVARDVERLSPRLGARHVVRNGVDTEHFTPGGARAGRPFTVAFSGRLITLKGIDTLIAAFAVLRRRVPDARLVLAGGGNASYWGDRAADAGLGRDAVSFLGHVPYADMPSFLHGADALVLPSRSESMPYAVLEAMACGLPVVATRVGGIPEIIDDGRNGVLFRPNNHTSLAGHLSALAEDVGLRARLGKAARQTAIDRHTLGEMVRQTRRELAAAAGAGAAGAGAAGAGAGASASAGLLIRAR